MIPPAICTLYAHFALPSTYRIQLLEARVQVIDVGIAERGIVPAPVFVPVTGARAGALLDTGQRRLVRVVRQRERSPKMSSVDA